MLQSLLGGGGAGRGDRIMWTLSWNDQNLCHPIGVFAHGNWHLHIPSEIKYHCVEGVYVYKVYRDSQICPIRLFVHGTWHIHIPSEKGICCGQQSIKGDQKYIKRRKKISWCYNRGITHLRVTFNSLENLVPAQVSASRRTESHKKQSNTTQ